MAKQMSLTVGLALSVVVVLSGTARAATLNIWDGSNDVWTDGTKWSLNVVPSMDGTHDAEIGSGTCTYNSGEITWSGGSKLTVKGTGTFSRSGTLNLNNVEIALEGGTFALSSHFRMGRTTPATWSHSGGTANLHNMYAADSSGGAGSQVNVSNTAILAINNNLTVGTRGNCTYSQTGGTVTADLFQMGHSANRNTTIGATVSGGTVDVDGLTFDTNNGAMVISTTGEFTTDALTFNGTVGTITIEDSGVLNILESHKDKDTVEAMFGTEILGTGLQAEVVGIGGTDYVQVTVPEPGALGLLVLGGVTLAARRRRRK